MIRPVHNCIGKAVETLVSSAFFVV